MNRRVAKQLRDCAEIICPFCGDDGFDKIGLKFHLSRGHCQVYEETQDCKSFLEQFYEAEERRRAEGKDAQ